MPENIKKYFGWAATLAQIACAWCLFSVASAYSNSVAMTNLHTISVSGDGKAIGIPDVAVISLSVISEGGKDMAVLQKTNTEKMNKIIDFVKSKGVDSKDVKTESYSVSPRYQYSSCGYRSDMSSSVCPPPSIVGYTITQSLTVKVRKFDSIGEILANAVTLGANNVSGPSFTIDDPASLQNQARAEAFAKAKASAQAMAKAGGFKLGRIISVGENNYAPYRYSAKGMDMSVGATAEMIAPSIEAGSTEITSTVSVSYEIK